MGKEDSSRVDNGSVQKPGIYQLFQEELDITEF